MPPKLPIGPPGFERELRGAPDIQKLWPRGPGFHEESAPLPRPRQFRAVAQRYAEHVARGERPVYVKAVAREATKRLLRLHLFEQPNRELLVGYKHAQSIDHDGALAYVRRMHREMAWEREKWSVQRNPFQWRRFGREPEFTRWLQGVSAENLHRWGIAYLPDNRRALSWARRGLAQLAPMPSQIHRAYFLATATDRRLLTLAGVEMELGLMTEHHVCRVCQCFRLAWRHSEMLELERKVCCGRSSALWAATGRLDFRLRSSLRRVSCCVTAARAQYGRMRAECTSSSLFLKVITLN
jgi:hypothetical protein